MMELREPTLNERRCIIRHQLGFYKGLVTAAIYQLPHERLADEKSDNVTGIFRPAIGECVQRHPILGAVIDGPDTEEPRFRRLQQIDLAHHLQVLELDHHATKIEDEHDLVEQAIEYALNAKFDDVRIVPPWRVYVVPLQSSNDSEMQAVRCLALFNYSHSHGDGLSGVAFHKSLLSALIARPWKEDHLEIHTTIEPLPPTLGLLPISWSYLFEVLVKEFMPWLHSWWNPSLKGTPWTGAPTVFDDDLRSATTLIRVDSLTLTTALTNWRQHGIKLTALLHLVIVRSLTRELKNAGIDPDSFVSGTPIDLRKMFALSPDAMGVNASSVSFQHSPVDAGSPVTDAEITAAREHTRLFAHASSTTKDQIIGLLKYATPLRKWHLGKLGKPRDTSYEVSNVMAFDPTSSSNVRLQRVFFAQPGDASGVPITFNVVGLKDGGLSILICWQIGAVGLTAVDGNVEVLERSFVARLAATFADEFRNMSSGLVTFTEA